MFWSVDILVKKAKISFENNQIVIDVDMRIIAHASSEVSLNNEVLEVTDANPSLSID